MKKFFIHPSREPESQGLFKYINIFIYSRIFQMDVNMNWNHQKGFLQSAIAKH